MPKTFNSDFYVACATVIPVLFLAYAVQGDAYKNLLDIAVRKAKLKADDGWVGQWKVIIVTRTLQQIAYSIWYAGAAGEILALQMLYQEHDSSTQRLTVFVCTVWLILAVAAGPYSVYRKMGKQVNRQLYSPLRPKQPDDIDQAGSTGVASSAETTHGSSSKASGLGWPEVPGSGIDS